MLTCAIPTLNGAATLEWTLLSLRDQPGVEVTIVVVDSGSSDATLALCAKWNVPTRYVAPGNMYAAVNAGLHDARTPWVTYLNADDVVYPGAFARLMALAEREGADVAYGDVDLVDERGRHLYALRAAEPRELVPLFGARVQGLPQAGTIFSRTLYEQLGGFSTDFRFTADADFFLRALQRGARFAHLRQPVCAFRQHPRQLSVRHAETMRAETDRVRAASGSGRVASLAALARWRLRNAPNYAARILRTGRLRGSGAIGSLDAE